VPLDLPEAEQKDVEALAAAADPAQLARLFDLVQRSVTEVKLADQPRFALEVALLKGAVLAPGADVAALLDRAEALAAGRPTPAPPATPAARPGALPAARPALAPATPRSASPPAASLAAPLPAVAAVDDESYPLAERWRAAVAEVEAESPTLGVALKQATLVSLGSTEVRIRFPAGTKYPEMVERKRGAVEKAFSGYLGRPIKLAIEVGPGAPAEAAAPIASIASVDRAEREARSARLRDEARTHPNIQEAAKMLGAEIDGTDEL
jgi:DNA polymerase-3 subunit gamma/tau